MRWLALLTGAALAGPVAADDLVFPVDCTLGVDCVIQQYVDRQPGPGTADFTCGPLTYEGHRGTDIRLPDNAAMARGVAVLSASSGVVLGTRDGMADVEQGGADAPDVGGKECGNGVLVQRADGWRFQYCHLRNGSVSVRKGDEVAAGDRLGEIGLSGKTQFPHLHLTIRDQARRVIDPFDARQQDESCTLKDRRTLWRDLDAQSYQPGGPLAAGFTDHVPDYDEIRAGTAGADLLPRSAPALVFWAHFFGLRDGDRIALSLETPSGKILAENTHVMERTRAAQYRAVGRKARAPWPPGTYRGEARLLRSGDVIDSIEAHIEIR